MKSIKNIYKASFIAGFLALSSTSCTEWLTIYPQDRVVEENFWEDKNDLEGVRYGAYKQMGSTISRLAIWGDLRSDSYSLNSTENGEQRKHKFGDDKNDRDIYDDILKGMPDSSMKVFDWGGVYTTINYCNKVLQHGEEVLAKDKQFTSSEWMQMKAEMTALRALNYFYLIRAFKDVPYTTKVVNSDAEVESFPQTNQLIILDNIIADCQSVEGQARNRFTQIKDTKGLITNCAIYAMLADMYLWRGSLHEGRFGAKTVADYDFLGHPLHVDPQADYQKAVEYADKALASLAQQNVDELEGQQYGAKTVEKISFNGLQNCEMIKNIVEGVHQSTTPKMEAWKSIFQDGNSIESIFELQFAVQTGKNEIVNHLWGVGDGTELEVSQDGVGAAYGGWMNQYCKFDSRMWFSAQNLLVQKNSTYSSVQALAGYYCMKYNECELKFDGTADNREIKSVEYQTNSYSGWIVYRMTDVMLMKAEALCCLGKTTDAMPYVRAIHRRSYIDYKKGLIPSTDATKADTQKDYYGEPQGSGLDAVMNERQIELLGEGKRWFDLVRFAERKCTNAKDEADEREGAAIEGVTIGNGQSGVTAMVDKYLKNAYSNYYTTLKNRFKNRYGLYCPVYYMEIKASNGALLQNPVWNKSKYEQ